MLTIEAKPLTAKEYQPFGDVIEASSDRESVSANMGTAQRFHHVAQMKNERPEKTKPNLSIYRCQPYTENPIKIALLEKHPHSTQAFIPMKGSERYLIVVCLGGEKPDCATLKAFVVKDSQGITYKPGIWHHPMIALDQETDLASFVWEDGTEEDCIVQELEAPSFITV